MPECRRRFVLYYSLDIAAKLKVIVVEDFSPFLLFFSDHSSKVRFECGIRSLFHARREDRQSSGFFTI